MWGGVWGATTQYFHFSAASLTAESLSQCLCHSPQPHHPLAHVGTGSLSHVGACPAWHVWEGREVKKKSWTISFFAELWSSQSILVAQGCGKKGLLGQDKICLDMSMVLKCFISERVLEWLHEKYLPQHFKHAPCAFPCTPVSAVESRWFSRDTLCSQILS